MDDEEVLLSIQEGAYFQINSVGTRIWELLEQPCYLIDIIAVLVSEFDVDKETCQREVESFLKKLENHTLLTKHDD